MHVLITGGAGFIGSHLSEALLSRGDRVTVLDNFDPYYDPAVKRGNLVVSQGYGSFRLVEGDIRDAAAVDALFSESGFDAVVHLAAQAGVRHSLENPILFNDVNCNGTLVMLEAARKFGKPRFVLASTSSVYGLTPQVPFSENDSLLHCISPYGASKIACEKYAGVYHLVHGLSIVALRYFTVYGPRQRPDMAIHKFARMITDGTELPLFGDGSTSRDYTYIADILQGVIAALDGKQEYDVVNLGNSETTTLIELVRLIEKGLGTEAKIKYLPEQPGDPPHTCADISHAREVFGYQPTTPVEQGVARFIEWFREREEQA